MRGAGRPGCGCGRMWQRTWLIGGTNIPQLRKVPVLGFNRPGQWDVGAKARAGEEGTGGMLLCVLVLVTLGGGLKSSLKGLYGHLLGHTSYLKNNFLLLFRDNSCVTPGGVWGSNLRGKLRRTGSFDLSASSAGSGKDALAGPA